MNLHRKDIASPLGTLSLYANEDALVAIYLPTHRHGPALDARRADEHPVLERAATQLAEYFDGSRTRFDLPMAPEGTAFQRRVWAALLEIPHGATATYGGIAARIGAPRAVRAVGAANGRNPLSIIVPCHRVIGHDGSLTGYGGGLDAKRWLLGHEAGESSVQRRAAPPSSR